jgi:hypothetical protein
MAMTKEHSTLCRLCIIARDQRTMTPRHLVHPVIRDAMLFDVRGEAVCPTCGARYRRTLNMIAQPAKNSHRLYSTPGRGRTTV